MTNTIGKIFSITSFGSSHGKALGAVIDGCPANLELSEEDIQRKFGFFVNALKYGTPPHGGLAFGLDRLTMILSGTDDIRDVIAFPKNLSAVCPMTNAPMPVDSKQLEDLGIKVEKGDK